MTRDSFVKAGFNLAMQVLYARADLSCPKFFGDAELPDLEVAIEVAGGNSNMSSVAGYEPLTSIFTAFASAKDKQDVDSIVYDAVPISGNDNFMYAHPKKGKKLNKDDYRRLVNDFEKNFKDKDWNNASANEVLNIWQQYSCLVPAEDDAGKIHDVSLYMRTKMAAAIAACQAAQKDEGEQEEYLFISGDISGIQDFIYTIPSKGALKSLRGRSFYLEIFMENFIDEMLDELDLTRANLLYVGGGHFYILSGNNRGFRETVKNLQNKCNQWFLKNYGTKLYIAVGCVPCTRSALETSEEQGNIFHKVSEAVNTDKLRRYGNDTSLLSTLFDPNSIINKHEDGSRECGICHNSMLELHHSADVDCLVCANCAGLYELGEKLIDEECLFVIGTHKGDRSIAIFGGDEDLFLQALTIEEVKNYPGKIKRIYTKQSSRFDEESDLELNLVDYSARDRYGHVKDFKELSVASVSDDKGIKRLAVLRADVDNLGAAFLGGFSRNMLKTGTNITRYADLSNALAVFFKRAVDKICDGRLPPGQVPFHLFGTNPGKRQIHVVYSGGDDMFFVGAWEDLLELAVDIREAFRIFTNNKLTFSAGLAIFHHSYPISKMAEQTGELEDMGKKIPDKDGIALFGLDTEQKGGDTVPGCQHIYKWETFCQKVCGEKLQDLLKDISTDPQNNDKTKIKIGKGQLYNLMELLDKAEKGDIKLARLAYWLGRLQPSKDEKTRTEIYEAFTRKMYGWFKDPEDCKQLRTAIILMVYKLRDTEKEV